MTISVFDLFKIGIGPSSSHTVGPMIAARQFSLSLREDDVLNQVAEVRAELYGSLGATGKGHGSDKAVILGLEGQAPDRIDPEIIEQRLSEIRSTRRLNLAGERTIEFRESEHLVLHRRKSLPHHPNGMRLKAFDSQGIELYVKGYYSIGGGFVVDEDNIETMFHPEDSVEPPLPFSTGAELLRICEQEKCNISDVMLRNEQAWRSEDDVRRGLLDIWKVMEDCVARGCRQEGVLPGSIRIQRRAPQWYRTLNESPERNLKDPLTVLDWVSLYAMAVNEENAAGGRVVTAPTNGAAGIIPAVLHYYARFCNSSGESDIVRFLLTAGAIGILFKVNASISGAEVGCQGEVGSACSMAAGALAEVLGGTPQQVENAAEIGMEHNLGLTCDPIGGLVQVPCIERNAMAATKAINAARMALRGDGTHFVSLDNVIKTMRETGADMKSKYKETARGGLAVHVVDVPVNIVEC